MRAPTDQEMAEAAALVAKIDAWLASKGHTHHEYDAAGNIIKQGTRPTVRGDHSKSVTVSWDGEGGYFIDHWGAGLGDWPTPADGFTASQLRKAPVV